ncbi:hypothetical protein MLD38_031882 [Melastoma candidum]|uniref:Uncharacterized protein n=1 Tax=Melastoma candidum TaxID=119954 RepID=A0ACB9MSG4_9MYRT|nr:hypothetical protein MLD38_031882 [Melastoma candidum]
MAPSKWILAVILIIFVSFVKKAASVPNTTEVETRCGPPSDSMEYELATVSVRLKLVRNTGRRGGNYYTSERVNANGEWRRCYGHATCNTALPIQDCNNCLAAASVTVVHNCPRARSARTRLVDCYIRYSRAYFYEGCKITGFETYLSPYHLTIISLSHVSIRFISYCLAERISR